MNNPLDALVGTPWMDVYNRMAAAIQGLPGEDYLELPVGKHQTSMEKWARAAAAGGNPVLSMSLTLPIAMAALSTATQGGVWMNVTQPDGTALPVPCIFQATVIAPSGYGKSAVLNPLVDILDKLNTVGAQRRRKMIMDRQAAALTALKDSGVPGAMDELDLSKVRKIFTAGICSEITLDQGTPEGIRDALLAGGGHSGILTAEPDILREVSAYAKDGGTFRWMLDGWNGDKIAIARATGRVVVPKTCLPYAIVVQPIAFDMFNRAARGQEEGVAADSAVGRGLYGRSWLIRISRTVGASAFGLTAEGKKALGVGQVSDTTGALLEFKGVLADVMESTDAYRAGAGIAMAWRNAVSGGQEEGIGVQEMPEPVWLTLSPAAQKEYLCVQNLRLALGNLVADLEGVRVGTERLFTPMVSRLTQHILRIAMKLTLCEKTSVVDAWAVRDAGTRIVPWLFGQWAQEMRTYAEEATTALAESEARRNPRGMDLTPEGSVKRGIHALGNDVEMVGEEIDAEIVFRRDDALKKALGMHSSSSRTELYPLFQDAFNAMLSKGWMEEISLPRADGQPGRQRIRFRVTSMGKLHGL